jgi:Subtilase family
VQRRDPFCGLSELIPILQALPGVSKQRNTFLNKRAYMGMERQMQHCRTAFEKRLFAGLTGALACAGSLMLSLGSVGAAEDQPSAKIVDAHGDVRTAPGASGSWAAEQADTGMVGKLERELAELLVSPRAAVGDRLNVIYVLKSQAGATERGVGDERLDALEASIAAASEPMMARLSQTGHDIIYRARYANVIVAAAPASGIRAMEAYDNVEGIYLERVNEPRLSVSHVVTQAGIVNGLGIRGSDIRVGVVEPDRIANHDNLPGSRRILCRRSTSRAVSRHKTNVAGVIQSTNGTYRGMAPLIEIVDGIGADFSDAEMMAATDCVIRRGAVAVNMSFGVDTDGVFNGLARYVDETVYNTGRTIIVSVSSDCGLRIGSPEIAFNSLSVGSYSDGNTVDRADDLHSCDSGLPAGRRHSSFLDPISPNNDREEPNLLGPGDRIRTTRTSNRFETVDGTSFAAPHVTGIAGLIHDRAGASIEDQNERIRAILMASARKNIEGNSRLSELDGTGSVQAAAAIRVLLNNQSYFFERPGGSAGFPINQNFTASAGQRTRVVVVWSHKPSGSSSEQPTTDLDLVVLRPGGMVVGSSESFDNTYEIVQFVAPVTGTYRARISNLRPSAGTEFIGLAVSRTNS